MRVPSHLAIPLAVTLLSACQQSDDTEELETQLGEHFAGLTESDEAPLFGEGDVFAALDEAEEDPEYQSDDPIETDARMQADLVEEAARSDALPDGDRPLVWGLFVAWGRQHLDREATDITVWNPTLHTDCGALAVRRLVAMEEGEGVARPRSDAQTVSFRSATAPSFDGAFLVLGIRRADAACVDGGVLRFESQAMDAPIEVPLGDLDDLALRQPVGDDGMSVVMFAQRLEPSRDGACVHGTMVGRWRRAIGDDGDARRDLGRFHGRVLDEVGRLRGHVRGVWGVPRRGRFAGHQVMFGKFIDRDGRFNGLLAGRWGDGHFGGGWHLTPRFLDLRGRYMGVYSDADDRDPDGGFFRGRYASEGCLRRVEDEPLARDDEETDEPADRPSDR